MVPLNEAFSAVPSSARSVPERLVVEFPQAKLDGLYSLLAGSRIGPVTFESSQPDRKYGITTEWLQEAKRTWLEDFDCAGDDAAWLAWSFLEFLPLLQLLVSKYTPETLPYHIIVPSLPGYTLSSPPPQDKDFRLEDAASILDSLMSTLGFGSETGGYIVQGGDVSSKLARVLGGTTTNSAKAVHLNFCIMPDPINFPVSAYSALDQAGIERAKWFKTVGSAYALEQATRPSTIGLTLSSSPLALLAWVGEKFLEWTDSDPDLHTILEDVTLYWLTNCTSTCLWPYRQLFTPGNIGAHENPEWHIHKPLGFSWFPKEIAPVPKAWVETTGNLVWFRQHDKGGHFAALERPEVLLSDFEDFVAEVWPGIEQGCNLAT